MGDTWLQLDAIASALRWPVTICYLSLVGLIGCYGLHRYRLVYLFRRHGRPSMRGQLKRYADADLPAVTVQLPMYNEQAVAVRIIDAAAALDYPADKLQIQVLDDSTDGTATLTLERVRHWQAQGVNIQHLHRTQRTGFKAGALNAGLASATGELIAIFDADFVPPRNFLRRSVHPFTDAAVGMVQTRWAHLNREDSLLTRGQAIFLDGHFVIEHTARNRSGAWINFNGTAGLWRKTAIADAGGWHHDTLTEDVDLSYRAQLRGWRFVFLPHVTCPAELPPEINAFKSQQHRWTKGSIQTALKLLPAIVKSRVPLHIKLEAFFHLTSPMVYLFVTLFALLFYPAIAMNLRFVGEGTWLGVLIGMALFGVGTLSATVFYITSQAAQRRGILATVAQTPLLMAIGIGIALYNAIACLEALVGHQSEFVRTPKYANTRTLAPTLSPTTPRRGRLALPNLRQSVALLELLMGAYMLVCLYATLQQPHTLVATPFVMLFAAGYLYVGLSSAMLHVRGWLDQRRLQPALAK